jgi:FkbM family methyltransferase
LIPRQHGRIGTKLENVFMKQFLLNSIFKCYQRIFARRFFARWNKLLFQLSLRGLGVLNYGAGRLTGETAFLKQITAKSGSLVVLDVGANEGDYASELLALAPSATVYAFEPHPRTYERLSRRAEERHFSAFNFACGSAPGRLALYDYQDRPEGSYHASFYSGVIEQIHQGAAVPWDVEVITIDDFVEREDVRHIDLLKIDTEGHEYEVLLGARRTLARGAIDTIHLEFNEMNVYSRVFCRDFYELLKDYDFFRMLPDGLLALGPYWPVTSELFGYQNLVAVHRKHT